MQPETQTIKISSTVNKEVVKITLNNMATQSVTEEVQKVTVTFTDVDTGTFRLGMYGAYTGTLIELLSII